MGATSNEGGSSRDYRAQQIAASAGSFWRVLSGFTGTFGDRRCRLYTLGVLLGVRLHRRISAQLFYRVSYALLFATGAKLFFDALTR